MAIGQTVVPYATFQEAYQSNPDQLHSAVLAAANQAAGGDPVQQQRMVAAWHNAIGILSQDAKPVLKKGAAGNAILHTPQNDLASRLQTLLLKQATAAGQVQTEQPPQTIPIPTGDSFSLGVFSVKFDNADLIGWLQMFPELIFKPPKAAWVDPPLVPQTIPDNARIAVFADWGTGLYGAPAIKVCIEGLDRCDVVLHLGDTYYSGEDDEIRDRLVGNWPQRPAGTINRSLNGNHEMYSGGKGYFQALTTFFQQPASCFALQNSNWVLVCLDTAYQDFDLDQKQVAWVNSIVAAAGTRKLILFSHHQPFSQLDDQGPNLQVALADLLNKQRIHAWFWGHEHRLVIYDPHPIWGFKGRCIGHGGFPAFRDDLPDAHGDVYQWLILPAQPQAPRAQLLDGPNFWVPQDTEGFSPHGFVVLDFDGDTVWETYRVPNNIGLLKAQL
ncbi:MAG TPA: metallophosphoesterase [Bryobacteraceae bacterium]|nr:metallophosphoesterase [Bryobacteraceae bacterium]